MGSRVDSLASYANSLSEQIERMTGDEGEYIDPALFRQLTKYLYRTSAPRLRPCRPVAQPPGSPGKLLALARRAEQGQELWHPQDGTWERLDRVQQRVERALNGSIVRVKIEGQGNCGSVSFQGVVSDRNK